MADQDYKHGGWKEKYRIFKVCKTCDGSGFKPCDCRGRECIHHHSLVTHGKCVTCEGRGYVPTDEDAMYFVLRLDADPHARKAALEYARSVRPENEQFADDIESKVAVVETAKSC